jgi:hypothetical protein
MIHRDALASGQRQSSALLPILDDWRKLLDFGIQKNLSPILLDPLRQRIDKMGHASLERIDTRRYRRDITGFGSFLFALHQVRDHIPHDSAEYG